MRYLLLVQILLLSSVAFGGDQPAVCELANESIVSQSSSGLAQVSNVGGIQIICHIPARPFPTKPGESRNGLRAATTVYEISADGSKKEVSSEVHMLGVRRFAAGQEFAEFYVHIPLEPAERDAEARRYIAKLEQLMQEQIPEEAHRRAIETLQQLIYQLRVGRFHIECHVLDGERVMGTGTVQLEVLFKGRFSDVGLPAAPPV